MAMSDRQFAAAHDRYLEPPDDDNDGTTDDVRCGNCAHYRSGACEDSTGADGYCFSFHPAVPQADEMDLADIERQNQIDHEDWLAEQYRQRQEDDQ